RDYPGSESAEFRPPCYVSDSLLRLKTLAQTIACGGLCRKFPGYAIPWRRIRRSSRFGRRLGQFRPVGLLHPWLQVVLGERLCKELANLRLFVHVVDLEFGRACVGKEA